MAYWSPYLLCVAAVVLAIVSTLTDFVSGLGLRRWFQSVTLFAWVLMGGVAAITIVYSSPWMLLGVVLIVFIAVAVLSTRQRIAGRVDDEAFGYLQSMIAIMSADLTIEQALRASVQSADFAQSYPRLTAQAREIIVEIDARQSSLSRAIARVSETAPGMSKQIWENVGTLARMIEDQHGLLPTEAQRDTLQSLWSILFDFYNIQRGIKREMTSLEFAKWIFALILPGINIYMFFVMDGYRRFLQSTVGLLVLSMDVLALVLIFAVFSALQKLPKVRI
jgi:hypothetical protein